DARRREAKLLDRHLGHGGRLSEAEYPRGVPLSHPGARQRPIVNGLLIVDKPAGITSHDVVARARRETGEQSIGHLGTLDPMATGVLPLLLGKYTRLAQFFGASGKAYTGTIRFGFATDTYDAEGQPLGEPQPVFLTLELLRKEAARFLGTIEQMPPPYSAKKIQGK